MMPVQSSKVGTWVGMVVLVAACAVALSGCWETDVDDSLYIRNDSEAAVAVEYEWSSGERIPLLVSLEPDEERVLSPPADPDVEGSYKCTTGPLIVLQNGEEIMRFDPPVCYGEGLTLSVDGEQ